MTTISRLYQILSECSIILGLILMSENTFSSHMIVIYGEVAIFVCNFNYNQQTSALKGHNRFST